MKKTLILALVLAMLAMLVVVPAAFADDATTTTITWDGAGSVNATVNSGDSNAGVNTGGAYISGSFTAVDSNNNPYNYGVDNFSSLLTANVTDGYITTGMARLNSYAPMYGVGGQTDYSSVLVDGGTASMAFRSTTNYAQLVNASYGYQLPGGHNIVAVGDLYQMTRTISDGRGDSAAFNAMGTGSAILDCMSSEASGAWNLTLGRGAGCYTDANFNATGMGTLQLYSTGVDSVTLNGMGANVTGPGANITFLASWSNSVSLTDYSVTAH